MNEKCKRCKKNKTPSNRKYCSLCASDLKINYDQEEFLRYEKLDILYPVLVEELEELKEAIEKENYHEIYEECRDVSIVLVSIFNTVRLYKEGYISIDQAQKIDYKVIE